MKLLEYVVYETQVRAGTLVLKKECLGVLDKDEKKGWMHGTMVSRWAGASELGRGRGRQQHRHDACASSLGHFVRPVDCIRRGLHKGDETHAVIIHRKSCFQQDLELILFLIDE